MAEAATGMFNILKAQSAGACRNGSAALNVAYRNMA
jgi:hypothetical protein